MRFVQFLKSFHKDDSGQDLIEYALVVAAVATAAVAGSWGASRSASFAIQTPLLL